MNDVIDSISVDTAEEEQEEGVESHKATHHIEHERLEDLLVVKHVHVCVRKRKMDEEAIASHEACP